MLLLRRKGERIAELAMTRCAVALNALRCATLAVRFPFPA
jgi:hypothetical protein